jgi:hypothetical protein
MPSIESILNSKKIRYENFSKIISNHLPDSNSLVILFVDVFSILRNLYQQEMTELFRTLPFDKKFSIAAELINLAAHYKHYFWSRHNIWTEFYFYYSSEPCRYLKKIFPDYNKTMYEKLYNGTNPVYSQLNETIMNNIRVAKMISEYIPYVYFIDTMGVDPKIFPYLVNKRAEMSDVSLEIILSNDLMAYQHVLTNDKFVIQTVKSEKSEIIDRTNLYAVAGKSEKLNNINIIPEFYPYILSISGVDKYEIRGKYGVGVIKACQMVKKWIDEGVIQNIPYLDPDTFIEGIMKSKKPSEEIATLIKNNFPLISLQESSSHTTLADWIKLETQIVDKNDAESLRYINDKYFSRTQIHLQELTEGENYE